MKKIKLRRQRGMILLFSLIMLSAILAIGVAVAARTLGTSHHVRRDYHDERVFNVAEGGANVAESWLRNLLRTSHDPNQSELDAVIAPCVADFSFAELSITKLPFQENVQVTRGPLAGLTRSVQPYLIRSHAANANSNTEKVVEVVLNQTYTMLYQYAIFYDADLELWPAISNPSVYQGHIHSNSNIYLGATRSNFDIIGSVTAAGHIFNTPKDPWLEDNGKARIADPGGQFHDLSYDWRDPDWLDKSLDDWEGLVQDSAHGIVAAPFPIQTLPDPIQLIKRGDPISDSPEERQLRFRYRAGLKILDGVATDSLGNIVNITGVVSSESVKDWRENRNMAICTINLDSLRLKGLMPANGVIYISYSHANAAVRLRNGQRLPSGGLVIATDNPCYVQGDYNTIGKQPSSIFCDAFNLYSNAWLDLRANSNLNQRNASPTQINTCLVTGNKTTDPGFYGGGASSLIRLHERWSASAELTYRGSLVCLWESEQAAGNFVSGAPVFSEHHRNSAFDPDLLHPEYWPEYDFWNSQLTRASWRSY